MYSASSAVGVPAVLQRHGRLPGVRHLHLHHLGIAGPAGHVAQVTPLQIQTLHFHKNCFSNTTPKSILRPHTSPSAAKKYDNIPCHIATAQTLKSS